MLYELRNWWDGLMLPYEAWLTRRVLARRASEHQRLVDTEYVCQRKLGYRELEIRFYTSVRMMEFTPRLCWSKQSDPDTWG